jgi:hypothetical protein
MRAVEAAAGKSYVENPDDDDEGTNTNPYDHNPVDMGHPAEELGQMTSGAQSRRDVSTHNTRRRRAMTNNFSFEDLPRSAQRAAFASMSEESGAAESSRAAHGASAHAEFTGSASAHRRAAEAHRDAAEEHASEGDMEMASAHRTQARSHSQKARHMTRNASGMSAMNDDDDDWCEERDRDEEGRCPTENSRRNRIPVVNGSTPDFVGRAYSTEANRLTLVANRSNHPVDHQRASWAHLKASDQYVLTNSMGLAREHAVRFKLHMSRFRQGLTVNVTSPGGDTSDLAVNSAGPLVRGYQNTHSRSAARHLANRSNVLLPFQSMVANEDQGEQTIARFTKSGDIRDWASDQYPEGMQRVSGGTRSRAGGVEDDADKHCSTMDTEWSMTHVEGGNENRELRGFNQLVARGIMPDWRNVDTLTPDTLGEDYDHPFREDDHQNAADMAALPPSIPLEDLVSPKVGTGGRSMTKSDFPLGENR